jgi:glucokinase
VKNNTAQITNRESWQIKGSNIEKLFGFKTVRLVNDFVAVGYGLLTLNENEECLVLQKGIKNKTAPIAVSTTFSTYLSINFKIYTFH